MFADNDSVGVSCTGLGESFMKVGVARRVGYLVEDKGLSPREVTNQLGELEATRDKLSYPRRSDLCLAERLEILCLTIEWFSY